MMRSQTLTSDTRDGARRTRSILIAISVFFVCVMAMQPVGAAAGKNKALVSKPTSETDDQQDTATPDTEETDSVEEITTRLKVQRPQNPMMKVLIGDALEPTSLTAEVDFVVENEDRTRLMTRTAGDVVQIKYKNGKYSATFGDEKVTSTAPLRVTPSRMSKRVTVTNFENRPSWDTTLNDNIFFGSIEIVYAESSQRTVLVNVIPIERYVRGIAEAGNENDSDYLQALLTAARTYALYNIQHPTKHRGEPYILDATEGDQVYRGAGFSKRAPNIVAAQKATKAQVIMYNREPIIASYFSQSDGRTRSWSEVWSGEYPYAVSVDDPGCVGQTLLGHGVGMSAAGARYFAEEQQWEWRQILTYYYTGVVIETAY